jgi:hypothetical protein
MRNCVPNHNIAIVAKAYTLLQDHLMMMMMHDLLAAHMMRTTSLANSSSPYQSSRATPTPIDAGWLSDSTTSCASTIKSDIIEAWKRRKKKNHWKEAWKRHKKRRQLKLDRLKPVLPRL